MDHKQCDIKFMTRFIFFWNIKKFAANQEIRYSERRRGIHLDNCFRHLGNNFSGFFYFFLIAFIRIFRATATKACPGPTTLRSSTRRAEFKGY